MGNNKAHCRELSSELSVFQGREDILEINVTLPRILAAFESYSSQEFNGNFAKPRLALGILFYLFFKKPYKQSYFGRNAHNFTACEIVAPVSISNLQTLIKITSVSLIHLYS